ncbi:uncharacterized protein JCM6883_004692 [Sporobolomyces salmoneus]|uniref:uncharacterized protein n=1 Tax=Sporobolomyces salmoneus TaxID=183962 RepID=UPI00318267C9
MAAVPLDRHNGLSPSSRGGIESSRSFARSAYTASPSLGALSPRPVASSASHSSSTQRPRLHHLHTTPVRHETAEGATAIGEADWTTNQARPIGRARSEVDIRSRSRRVVDPTKNSNTLTTPSTSPIVTRSGIASTSSPGLADTSGFSTEYSGSPSSFVTARSIPVRTPPPRPTRSPHRDLSPSPVPPRTKSNLPPRSETKTTLIHGTEFEIVSALPPPAKPSTPSVESSAPPVQRNRASTMSSFTFPNHSRSPPPPPLPTLASSPASRNQQSTHHQSNGSVFRLERPPHAFPESYLAVRDSLSQTQIDQFTLSLAAQFPASWTTSDNESSSNSSVLSSPTKGRNGNAAGEGPSGGGETDDWARQRRMSSLISGLGMVLGSSSFGMGPLLMEEEEEEEDDEGEPAQEKWSDARGRNPAEAEDQHQPPTPASPGRAVGSPPKESTRRRSRIASAVTSNDAHGSSWTTSTRSRAESTHQSSFDSALAFHLDFDPVTFASLTSGSISLPLSSMPESTKPQEGEKAVAVEFGYATGGVEEVSADSTSTAQKISTSSEGEEGTSESIRHLVRQSWQLPSSGTGSREFKPLSPKRRTARPISQRFDDGLGITLEHLDFDSENSRAVPSSYTPSSRPVLPRGPSLDQFPQTTSPPVSNRMPDLPTSPPLVAEPPTPSLTMTPAFSSTSETSSPAPDSILSPPDLSSDPSDKSRSFMAASSPQPQPRTSSLAPNSLSSSTTSATLRRRSSNEDGLVGRRRSVLGASKSSKRISALFSSGMDKVRARTSSHNSKDADDEREKEDGRTARRRALTDGLISGPISSPALSTSTSTMPQFGNSTNSSSQSSFLPPPPPPTASLTQSPFHGRTWRSNLSLEQFEDLAQELGAMEMRRQEVIWELCETERSFVNGLRGVIQVFTLPLRTRNGTWIKGVPVPVSRLLDWLDDIVYLHSQIFEALEEVRINQRPVVGRIAEAFLPFVARLEVHQPYLVRFETVTRQIDEMAADSASDFGEFVRMQSSLPECGSLSLSSFLLKPVQRLMKYPLFFRQLCDLTPPTHPDHFSTLSLLHSTDSIIRVMQEVKTREDEYEETKVLESRISGLPNGFKLACRDRRLVAHGVLKRVHISDKDRSLLEMDAIARAGLDKPNLRGNAPISPGLSPLVDSARPRSTISESSSSSLSVGSLTYASDHSSGWNSPRTPGAFQSPTRLEFGGGSSNSPLPSPLLRPDSMISNSSSVYSDTSNKAASSAFDSNVATRRPARRVVKTKAKETTVYVFVFSDLVVLATKVPTPTAAFGSRSRRGIQEPSYRAIETVGLSRVLGVSDLSGKTEHEHLIEIDLLPIREGQDQAPLSLSNTSLASSIYLTLPPASSSRSPLPPTASYECQVKERIRWLQAFERSYLFALRSLSFPSLLASFTQPTSPSERLSCASYLDAGIVPKSPSQQYLEKLARGENSETTEDGSELEREERGWWAVRLKKVRKEMEGNLSERRNEPSSNGGGGVHANSWQPTNKQSSTRRQGGGVRPGQVVTYSAGQILPARRTIQT